MIVMEALGGPRERIREAIAGNFNLADVDPLNLIGIEVIAGANAAPVPFAAGLPDTYFENDGQLTKREVRAVTLSSLQPCPGELLWDVGAGKRLDRHRMAARTCLDQERLGLNATKCGPRGVAQCRLFGRSAL